MATKSSAFPPKLILTLFQVIDIIDNYKMDDWDSWVLSHETEERLSKILSKLQSDPIPEISNLWTRLFNNEFSPITDITVEDTDMECNEVDPKEEELINMIRESLQTNTLFLETNLIGVSYNTLNRIWLSIRSSLTEMELCTFCKFIASWSNDALVEESLKLVILPKLMEKNEASACVIHSIKELALSKPEKLCCCVLIPLLEDETSHFTDIELLREVYSNLQHTQKDLLIVCLTEKKDFHENDWLLLQALVEDLSQNSIAHIINCICQFSSKFTKSQVFGRFLVSFCKNLEFVNNKDLLCGAIDKHQTLLKKQALKFLESI